MGVQNFSGGGFYGKVGVHVGQRLYDKFIIRAWTKGTNPRTQRQIKWRSFFGTASKRASASLNINPNSGVFARTDCPVMGQRIEAAVDLERSGAEFLDLYPVFPKGYNPTFIGSTVTKQTETQSSITLALTGSLPSVERKLGALIAFYDSVHDSWEIDFSSGTFYPTTGGGIAVLQNAWYGKWTESTNIVLITDDDKAFQMQTYWQRMTPVLDTPVVERAFDFTIESFHRTGRNFVLEFAEAYVENSQTLGAVTVRAVVAGAWQNVTLDSPALVQNGTKFALKFSAPGTTGETIWAFPSGASVTFDSVNVYADHLHLTGTNVAVSVTSTDLIRQIDAEYFSLDECQWADFEDVSNVYYSLDNPFSTLPALIKNNVATIDGVLVPSGASFTLEDEGAGESRNLSLQDVSFNFTEFETGDYAQIRLEFSAADGAWRGERTSLLIYSSGTFWAFVVALGVSYRFKMGVLEGESITA